MFWDSRASYDVNIQQFSTPSHYLNGASPVLNKVTALLPNALEAEVLLPMVNHLKMRGMPGENEIANALDENVTFTM
ncbi:MAG: hypothetical protein MI976_28390 [Pseudomonadales bacterium]|nr:hypothetical protein [Pseudomonadales bacterium]